MWILLGLFRESNECIPDSRRIAPQQGRDLGRRMLHALRTEFCSGSGSVVVIGTDCLYLNPSDLRKALAVLQTRDAVVGPAEDGGYYLIGFHRRLYETNPAALKKIFMGISWSASTVCRQTLQRLISAGVTYQVLAKKADVDTPGDLTAAMLEHLYPL